MKENNVDELFYKKYDDNYNKEDNIVIKRTKEYLFVLENQLELKDKEINKFKSDLSKTKEEFNSKIDMLNEDKFIFSIIMPIYNTEKYLSQAVDSVINQNFIFDNVEIILMDDGSTDNCPNICKEYVNKFPNNIKYVRQENQGLSASRNNGLKVASGKFVNFLDSDDKFEPDTLNEVYYHFNKFGDGIDIIHMARWAFDAREGPFPFFNNYKGPRIVDITEEPDFAITSVASAFLRKDIALKFEFNSKIILSEDCNYLNKVVLEKGKFGVVDSVKYLYRKRIEEDSLVDSKKVHKEYFNPRMNLHFKDLINYSIEKCGEVIKYIQSVLIYDLKWFFLHNTEVGVLDEEELMEFYNNLHDVFEVIDDDIILSQNISKFIKYHMLNIKYNYPKLIIEDDTISFDNKVSFDNLSNNKVILEDPIENDVLKASFKFYSNEIKLKAKYDDNDLELNINDIEEDISISRPIGYKYNLEIKLDNIEDIENIKFIMEFNSKEYSLLTEKDKKD